jgi:hypothetical protein
MRVPAFVFVLIVATARPGFGLPPAKPVPPSPYLPLVYQYANAMLERGRDTHGPQKTGLLLSALDRSALAPLGDRPSAPAGVAEALRAGAPGRPLVGSNPQHDQNLLRVLYTLSELSTKPVYRDAADAELKRLLQHAPAGSALPPWDAGFAWDVVADEPIPNVTAGRMPPRPWMLWDRCFELEPDASKRLVLGLREARGGGDFRQAGFAIRAYAVAYQHTKDATILKAIEDALARLEAAAGDDSAAGRLSAAVDCGDAAKRVPEPLAERLRACAAREGRAFCDLPHDLKGKGGFVLTADGAAPTPPWRAGNDGYTTAMVAMMCVSRYENTGDVRFRDLVHAAADAYRGDLPAADADAWPMTFGHAISLQLAAWRSTARREYLDRAIELADLAVKTFWDDGPLPRAGTTVRHYETVTGADTLALALVELHLSILGITAVPCPPNTIDR